MKKLLTQKEKLSDAFKAIKPNVTADDRKAAETELGKEKSTISRYLGGRVMDLDTGIQLYTFFKKRIDKREKAIA
jgi:DNA-directed RNA polymerase specialized sigma54-like protein